PCRVHRRLHLAERQWRICCRILRGEAEGFRRPRTPQRGVLHACGKQRQHHGGTGAVRRRADRLGENGGRPLNAEHQFEWWQDLTASPFEWEIPERFNIAVACTDAQQQDSRALVVDDGESVSEY